MKQYKDLSMMRHIKPVYCLLALTLAAANVQAQDSNTKASRLLHKSVRLTSLDSGLCHYKKFIKGINRGGDLTSQSDIYHGKRVHQNVLNAAIAHTCYEIALEILNVHTRNLTQKQISLLVNDPQRVLTTSPLKRTINKGHVELFKTLITDFPVRYDIEDIARKIGNQNRVEMATILIEEQKITSLNSIYKGLRGAVMRTNPEVLAVFLNSDLAPLSHKRLEKLIQKAKRQHELNASDATAQVLELLQNAL